METTPITTAIKIEPFGLSDKCAEVYRNNSLGTYSFLCHVCDEMLDSGAADDLFRHLDSHYYFEGQEEHPVREHTKEQKNQVDTLKAEEEPTILGDPFETEFLDVQLPIVEEASSGETPISNRNENNEINKCNVCYRSFKRRYNYLVHCKKHVNKKVDGKQFQKCEMCKISFNSLLKFDIHNETVHGKMPSCELFENSFTSESDHIEHLQDQKINITQTDEIFNNKNEKDVSEYYVHLKDQTNEYTAENGTVECDECGKILKTKAYLKSHFIIHSKNRPIYECALCDKKYAFGRALRLHHNEKHPDSIYTYNKSTKTFTNIKRFHQEQQSSNSIIFQFKCNVCERVFKNRARLTYHEKVHDPSSKKHACNFCEKKFRDQRNLLSHIRTHTGEKPYECEICQKRFIQRTELQNHTRRAHTGEKKHQCELCGKEFFTASALTVHRKRHKNEKPHKCQYCENKFNFTNQLKDHERMHTGEKPYSCKGCELKFRTSSGLRQHAILHTGAKPYKCKYCDMKFAQTAGRRGHEKSKHGAL